MGKNNKGRKVEKVVPDPFQNADPPSASGSELVRKLACNYNFYLYNISVFQIL